MYFPPHNKAGKDFVSMQAGLWRGVRERKWNSELALIFPACILRRSPGIFETAKIKQRVEQRLKLWKEGRIEALVAQIEGEAR